MLPAMVILWSRMPFYPERCGKVDPRLAISSRATCRFQLLVYQSVEFSVDMSVESEFSVDQLNCNFGDDIHVTS